MTRGEPRPGPGGELAHFSAYLDFYRDTCVEKCRSLPPGEVRASRLPSRWTPLELLQHLAMMERRWFVWGFLGEAVDEPWGDALDERWHVPAGVTTEATVSMLRDVGRRTSAVLAEHSLRVGDLDALGVRGLRAVVLLGRLERLEAEEGVVGIGRRAGEDGRDAGPLAASGVAAVPAAGAAPVVTPTGREGEH